jgi:hypothetical protein
MILRKTALLVLSGLPLFIGGYAGTASAEVSPDWYGSLMSDHGVEVEADQRIFTLFAALNALGYNAGPAARVDPIPRPELSEPRRVVRAQAPMSAALADAFQSFFDQHPLPLRNYVGFAAALGPAPDFALGSEPPESAPLRGLEQLLARYYKEGNLGAIYEKLLPQYRAALKGYLPHLDDALAAADKILKSPHGDAPPPPVIAVNLLDGAGSGFGVRRGGGSYLVIGPGMAGRSDDLATTVASYARVRAGPVLEERATAVKGLADLVQRVHRLGLPAGNLSAGDYLTRCFSLAVAAQAIPDQRAAQLQNAVSEGCWLTAELDRSLGEKAGGGDSSFESFVTGSLGALDAHRITSPPAGAEGVTPLRRHGQ